MASCLRYGVGYQMTMLKAPVSCVHCVDCLLNDSMLPESFILCVLGRQGGTQLAAVTALVTSIPGAEMISNVGTELAFRLPMQESAQLPAMLHEVSVCLFPYFHN